MIDGCLDWQAQGLLRPDSVTSATKSYFEEQDLFGRWLEERCNIDHRMLEGSAKDPLPAKSYGLRLKGPAGIPDGWD